MYTFQDTIYLDFSYDTNTDPSVLNYPTPKVYDSLARGGISYLFDDTTVFGESLFPRTIDSGTSLPISPDMSDSVGQIQQVDRIL